MGLETVGNTMPDSHPNDLLLEARRFGESLMRPQHPMANFRCRRPVLLKTHDGTTSEQQIAKGPASFGNMSIGAPYFKKHTAGGLLHNAKGPTISETRF